MNFFSSTRRVFAAVLVLGWFAMAARNVVDPDVWWHLKTGEYIAAHHAVPHSDLFSYTRGGQPWIAHEWLSDLLIFATYRTTGFAGLIVVFAAIAAATFFLLYLRAGIASYCSGVITLWGAWATLPLWGVRPQLISFLLMSLWLWLVEHSERNPKLLWWTLPLTILWVNLHAGFALGLALLALFLLGEFLEWLQTRSSRSSSHRRMLALVLAIDLLLVPLNPNGTQLYAYPFATLHSRAMQAYIAEWASPNFHQPEYLPFLLLILAVMATAAWSSARMRPRDLLMLSVSLFAALCSVRLIPFFVLMAVPIVARSLGRERAPDPWQNARRKPHLPHPALWNAAAVFLIAIFSGFHVARTVRRQPAAEAANFPAAALTYMQAHPSDGPIFNAYDWGGYIIWRLFPPTKVFIDGRADLYANDFDGESLLDQFADTYQLQRDWRKTLIQWQIGTVLVPTNAALATALRANSAWSIAYSDAQAIVLVHDNARNNAP